MTLIEAELLQGTDMKRSKQGPEKNNGGYLDTPGEIAVEWHSLHLAYQSMKPLSGKNRYQMPRQWRSQSSPQENNDGIKKYLPECQHAVKTTNFPKKRHTPLKPCQYSHN